MHILWELSETYDEIGGIPQVEAAIRRAVKHIPLDHQRSLDRVVVRDFDPRGKNLGVYMRDHTGNRVELYLIPHARDAQLVRHPVSLWIFQLHIAHTLFHEVGHHVTLTINKRMAPSKDRSGVKDVKEKWAEEYVAKRMNSFCKILTNTGGAAADHLDVFEVARRCLVSVASVTQPVWVSAPSTDDDM